MDDLKNLQSPVTPEMPDEMGQQGMTDTPQAGGADGRPGAETPEGMGQAPDQGAAEIPDGMDMGSQDMAQQDIDMPTVLFKDLADIKLKSKVESISKTNGEKSIGIQFVKAPDANTVEVVNNIKDKLTKLEKDYGITAVSTFDQGEPIKESINVMLEKAIFGIIFAVIVILLFLRNIRTTIISIVSIPLSLLMAMFLLHQMDISLNILTLGALTVAIGRVIDDSIVVMENIFRRMSLEDEALKGKEVNQRSNKTNVYSDFLFNHCNNRCVLANCISRWHGWRIIPAICISNRLRIRCITACGGNSSANACTLTIQKAAG